MITNRSDLLQAVRRSIQGLVPFAIVLLLIEFFDELDYGTFGAAFPALRIDLGLSYGQAGLLLGLPGILNVLFEPAIMLLGDTRLRKRLVIGGGIAIVLCLLVLSQTNNYVVALLALTIAYPASGAFVSLSQATLMDLNPGRETQMMARWTVFGSAGGLIGPAVVALFYALGLTWRTNFILGAVLALLLSLLAACYPFRKSGPTQPEVASANPDHTQPVRRPPLSAEIGGLLHELWQTIRRPVILRWFILLDLADLQMDVFLIYSALYFADVVGMTTAQVGLTMSALIAADLAATLALIPLLERVSGRKLVRITAVITGLCYIAWLLAPWPWAKVALAIVIRITTLGWYEVLQGEAYAAVPGRSGTVMTIGSLMGMLGGSLVWLIGWIAGQVGLASAMWLLLAGPIALAIWLPGDPPPSASARRGHLSHTGD